ncbi:major facilitator superfamily domain-containing protein [Cunninghamella echinulata]|nr:major facilitator superfamily domain-containing protein [Cunninghamella echinulata]
MDQPSPQSLNDKLNSSVLASCIAGSLVLWASFGVRQSIGVFLIPVTQTTGWDRATFSIAAALLQLMWGFGQPFIVFLAEKKFGFGKVIFASTILYAVSCFILYGSSSSSGLFIFACALQGIGCAGNSFPIVLASISKRIAPNNKYKSTIFGVVSSFGSFGQCCFLPIGRQMIATIGWTWTFLVFGIMMAVCSITAVFLQTVPQKQNEVVAPSYDVEKNDGIEKKKVDVVEDDNNIDIQKPITKNKTRLHPDDMTAMQTLKYAFTSPTFIFITLGFSTCGFHIAFMATHLPSYLQGHGVDASLAAWTISIIGLGSMFGTISTGILCTKFKPKYVLAGIYASRAIIMCIFFWVPFSLVTVFIFSVIIGFLWLSTVPPTTRFVGDVFGYKYLGTLTSITFVGHQIGAFLGAYMSGVVYDNVKSYDRIWIASISLGIFSAVANLLASDRIPDYSCKEDIDKIEQVTKSTEK